MFMKKFLLILTSLVLFIFVAQAESVIQAPMDILVYDIMLSGQYTGEIEIGLPEGFGVFETISPSGTPCHYIGQWESGLMNGKGAIYWNDGSVEIGEYIDGFFVSGKYNYNGLEMLIALKEGEGTLNPYWLVQTKAAINDSADEPTVKYIGNKNSHVFHTLDCDSVRTMKEKNKVEFYTKEDALEKDYAPCSRCSP